MQTKDVTTRISVLSRFLQSGVNVKHALQCLQAEARGKPTVQDKLRETGILEILTSYCYNSCLAVRNIATHTLYSCVVGNYQCRLSITNHKLFDELSDILLSTKLGSGSQFVSCLLLSEICHNNSCAQELMSVSGCLDSILNLVGKVMESLNYRKSDSEKDNSAVLVFVSLLARCVSYGLSLPSHSSNQRFVANHEIYRRCVLEMLADCPLQTNVVIEALCQIITSVYHGNDELVDSREKAITVISQKLRRCEIRHLARNISSLDALLKCIHILISDQEHILDKITNSCCEELCKMAKCLVRVCQSITPTDTIQLVLFSLALIVDLPGVDHHSITAESDFVKRLYQLTRLTGNPTLHCAVSYIMLGLDSLSSSDQKLVMKLAPECLVKMGLAQRVAKMVAGREHVPRGTRKQLFEADDVMELCSSDEDELLESVYTPIRLLGKRTTSNTDSANTDRTKWIQLTPPSRIKSLSSSPGWQTRVKRLRSLLRHRRKSRRKVLRDVN